MSRRQAAALIVAILVAVSGLARVGYQAAAYALSGPVSERESPKVDPLPRPTLAGVTPAVTNSGPTGIEVVGGGVIATVGSPLADERRIHATAWPLAAGVTADDDDARRRIAQLAAAEQHDLVETPRSFTAATVPAVEVATADAEWGWESLLIYLFQGDVVVVIDCDFQRQFDRDAMLNKQRSRLAACAGVVKSLRWATS